MKILKIIHVLRAPVGGLFRHVLDLAHAQKELGHEVGLIFDNSSLSDYSKQQLEQILTVCALGLHGIKMSRAIGLGDVFTNARLFKKIKQIRPDILHGHGAKGGVYARLGAHKFNKIQCANKIKSFYTPHGGFLHYGKESLKGKIFTRIERDLAKKGNGVIFESRYSQERFADLVGLGYCASCVVHNGLKEEEFTPIVPLEDAADLLFIGELRLLKGIDTLLKAIKILNDQDRTYRLNIVGDGPDETLFKQMTKDLGLLNQVNFLGRHPARDMFSKGKILVIPSRAEAFPYIVLEAGAAAIPMIVTNVGGISEITKNSEQTLIEPDNPGLLAHSIKDKLSDYQGAQKIANDLRSSMMAQFTVEQMSSQITDFYLS